MTTPSVNPSARVQRIPAPIASPGQCGMCGTAQHDVGFAVPDLDFEWYGTLIFCADCTGDIASVFGFLPPAGVATLQEQLEDQNAELNTLRQAVLGLESAVEGLVNYRDVHGRSDDNRRRSSDRDVVPVTEPKSFVTEPVEQNPDSVPLEPVDAGAIENNESNESAGKQGRDDVRDSASADVDKLLGL